MNISPQLTPSLEARVGSNTGTNIKEQQPTTKLLIFGLGLATGALVGVGFMTLVVIVLVKYF